MYWRWPLRVSLEWQGTLQFSTHFSKSVQTHVDEWLDDTHVGWWDTEHTSHLLWHPTHRVKHKVKREVTGEKRSLCLKAQKQTEIIRRVRESGIYGSRWLRISRWSLDPNPNQNSNRNQEKNDPNQKQNQNQNQEKRIGIRIQIKIRIRMRIRGKNNLYQNQNQNRIRTGIRIWIRKKKKNQNQNPNQNLNQNKNKNPLSIMLIC